MLYNFLIVFIMEDWRDIPGYEGYYQVSNLGRVKSLDRIDITKKGYSRHKKGIELKVVKKGAGYSAVHLSKNSLTEQVYVHRLVLEAFLFESSMEINHINGNKADNRLLNLEYVTKRENQIHALKTGLLNRCAHSGKFIKVPRLS